MASTAIGEQQAIRNVVIELTGASEDYAALLEVIGDRWSAPRSGTPARRRRHSLRASSDRSSDGSITDGARSGGEGERRDARGRADGTRSRQCGRPLRAWKREQPSQSA